ncbi:MAG: redoxin domain-containing protein [Gemmataceae bacterium]|nr:redoxin domain-containing protein [Gemmataceae bacterium]
MLPSASRIPSGYRWFIAFSLPLVVAIAVLAAAHYTAPNPKPTQAEPGQAVAQDAKKNKDKEKDPDVKAPELDGGVAWLNTDKPIKLKDLKGKIVILDFWTLCCINCIHIMPDLEKLEKKYGKELVVIGVHSAKFENEKETESIRKAILRYEIAHPVVNDANMEIWKNYDVHSWPTLCVIDPEGNFVGRVSGEGNYDLLDRAITKLIKIHKDKKTLNEKPLVFALERDRRESPLFFPGKVLAEEKADRLFIADSTHHRIVITDLNGKKIDVVGTGESGKADGSFDKATFNDPQGLAVRGDKVYVADRKNHLIRELDLKARTVKTIAGTGKQGDDRTGGGPGLEIGLNSPWDLCLIGDDLYIAMAGHHQLWVLDLKKNDLSRYAGNGRENIKDGSLRFAEFAQPSGLTTDGKHIYVADSEVSAIRSVPLNLKGVVKTLVGKGLFDFGDVDGDEDTARLQHALGVLYHEGKLYVTDTYNSKLKVIDPVKKTTQTFLGTSGGWFTGSMFNEPAGLTIANGKLYVADTNAHRIRVVDLKTKAVSTLKLSGVETPKLKTGS